VPQFLAIETREQSWDSWPKLCHSCQNRGFAYFTFKNETVHKHTIYEGKIITQISLSCKTDAVDVTVSLMFSCASSSRGRSSAPLGPTLIKLLKARSTEASEANRVFV